MGAAKVLLALIACSAPAPAVGNHAIVERDPFSALVPGARYALDNDIFRSTVTATVTRVESIPGGRRIVIDTHVDGGVQGVSSFSIEVSAQTFVVAGVTYPRRASWRGPTASNMAAAITTANGVTCFVNAEQFIEAGEDCGDCQAEVCVDDRGLVELEADLAASEGPYKRRSARQ